MKHTCDTARSGSEAGNTCAACLVDMADRRRRGSYPIPTGLGDITAEWERQTAGIGTKSNPPGSAGHTRGRGT